ncbi:MAG: hypothetical protein QF632_04500 [Candidatus Woesearchaeota archaeon]|jgi:hypothetical protein|nr:hypothetical protein [Candidatus Woesearchaeota archaeon]
MKQKMLEGVIPLRGRQVVLEDLQNPRLVRILSNRLQKDKFAFWGSSYKETKSNREKKHTDHNDGSHSEYHNDNYDDTSHHVECFSSMGRHSETARCNNSGYSETTDRVSNNHTDYYS